MLVPEVAIHLVIQFLPHTRAVGRLGFLEAFLNCPTHHRVHHAINPQYLNKNLGGTFIVWDKLFGTYEPEVEPCAYGVTPALRSFNPWIANWQFFAPLLRDAVAAPSWWDKIRVWFMPIGWRPRGLPPSPDEPPVRAATQVKYRAKVAPLRQAYLLAQLPLALLVMLTVSRHDSPLRVAEKVVMSSLLWVAMVSWGGLLESRPWATWLEGPKLLAFVLAAGVVYGRGEPSSPAALLAFGLGAAFALAFAFTLRQDRAARTRVA
jgi:hypothetical protein